ncbi:MAG: hypothetical protein AB8I08_24465 [Sandaracinaceae bacterium]
MRICLLTVLSLLPATAWAQSVPDDLTTPLDSAARSIAEDVPDEGTPMPGEHYPVSNEHRHDLFWEDLEDLGGAFVGVGSDQCYTLAAMQNARMVWLVDFDPLVPEIHRMYSVLVPRSETAAELIARFAPENVPATVAMLEEALSDAPDRAQIVSAFERTRPRIYPYLQRAQRQPREGSWLAEPTLYARVRALFVAGRIVARNGDVTAEGALRGVGRAATRLGLTVRVVYFSNAEQFFPYNENFRANLDGLPTDERSIVLRTFREEGAFYVEGATWHYLVQPVSDMHARIHDNGYRHSRQMVHDLMSARDRFMDETGVSRLDARIPRRYDLSE